MRKVNKGGPEAAATGLQNDGARDVYVQTTTLTNVALRATPKQLLNDIGQ